jgi:hypothetical protein
MTRSSSSFGRSPVPMAPAHRPTRGLFGVLSELVPEIGTGWRRGVDSNPRCREAFYGQNSTPVWRYSARQKASVPERICSPGIGLCSGCLRFASFARLKANARRFGTLERPQVQIRAIVWRRSPEFLPSSSPPHHVGRRNSDEELRGE